MKMKPKKYSKVQMYNQNENGKGSFMVFMEESD